MNRCVIIDIGSNTVRFDVFHYDEDGFCKHDSKTTNIGLISYIKDHHLSSEGLERVRQVLDEYDQYFRDNNLTEVMAFITASGRDIDNTEEFKQLIRSYGYPVDVLSSDEEATLDFEASMIGCEDNDGCLIDIGGGSTEIVPFEQRKPVALNSLPYGSLRMTHEYDDPMQMKLKCSQLLENIKGCKQEYHSLLGVGGTIRACQRFTHKTIQGSQVITIDDLYRMIDSWVNKDEMYEERAPLIKKERQLSMMGGLAILIAIMEHFHAEKIQIARFAVATGYFLSKHPNVKPHFNPNL